MTGGFPVVAMSMRPRIRGAASLLLGVASVTLSYWMLGFFAVVGLIFGCTDFTRHTGQSWRGFVFNITGPNQIGYGLGWLGLAVGVGCLGLWLAGPGRRERPRTRLVASAIRFCLGGLAGAFLDAVVLAALLAYRWLS